MHVTLVHIQVVPEHLDDFIAETRLNHEGSVRESGNRRFDVLQAADDPCRFLLYEAYVDADAAAAHKQTPHYARWRDRVAGWMAAPREGVPYQGLLPPA